MKIPRYSVILPIRNEYESIPRLFSELAATFAGKTYEVIAVDDASVDHSLASLTQIRREYPHVRIIHLPVHRGKWAALRAGFAAARGKVLITMDADLQDDPGELPKLLKKIDRGYDIVSGFRQHRQDPSYKVALTRIANSLISLLSAHRFRDFASPMKIYRKEAVSGLPKDGSLLRYSYFFGYKLGYRICEVPVAHRSRLYGQSKFGMIKYIRIVYDLILIVLLFSGSGRLPASKRAVK